MVYIHVVCTIYNLCRDDAAPLNCKLFLSVCSIRPKSCLYSFHLLHAFPCNSIRDTFTGKASL